MNDDVDNHALNDGLQMLPIMLPRIVMMMIINILVCIIVIKISLSIVEHFLSLSSSASS